ncbi:hypothetical protein LTR24_003089 [Lithohypha guttulata]|uniref:Uncharacterized protein n=1 Tax=Lithohypha guttulata TaxID=1690604 RepID=A0ABR0KFV2_9EURO|nr:hypothetical protein LTR24_003089 [Lithohypha guttulata]
MAKSEDFLSKSIAKKFFDNDDQHNDQKEGLGAKATGKKPKAASAGHGKDKTSIVDATSSEKIASAGDDEQGSFDFNTVPEDRTPIPAQTEESAWKTEEEKEKPAKSKAKKNKKRSHRPAPSDPDSDDDHYYDEFDGYEPELTMGDPRDREIAEILYGEGAGFNAAYFDHI